MINHTNEIKNIFAKYLYGYLLFRKISKKEEKPSNARCRLPCENVGLSGRYYGEPLSNPARQKIPLVDLSHLTVVRRGKAGIVV